ncbi:MAG: SpoIIE family protein phosphatase [Candidatus Kapaibacterium sp.]
MILFFNIINTYSSNFDSLLIQGRHLTGTDKIDFMNSLLEDELHLNPRKVLNSAFQNLNDAIQFNYTHGIAKSHHIIGNAFFYINYHHESDSIIGLAIKNYEQVRAFDDMIQAYIDRSNAIEAIGEFAGAKNYLLKALELADYHNKSFKPLIYNEIGTLSAEQGNINDAIEYLMKSLDEYKKSETDVMIPYLKSDIAAAYLNSSFPDSAIIYIHEARTNFNKLGNLIYEAKTYLMEGDYEKIIGNQESASQLYLKALNIFEEAQYLSGLQDVLYKLYLIEADNNTNLALQYLDKYANLMRKESEADFRKKESEKQLNAERIRKLVALERVRKTEDQLKSIQADKEIQELKNQKQTTLITMFIIVSVLLLIIAVVMYFLFKGKKKNNIVLQEVNTELNKKNQLIEKQKTEIEDKNTRIMDSIEYAKRIQKAILPLDFKLKSLFDEYFIFFKPKDIVSGDFYWIAETDEYKFVSVIDCTGHGVSGAFMSMIGNTVLNELVLNLHIHEPSVILNELDKRIRLALKQDYEQGANDGMDLGIVRISKQENIITFSGAKRPLYLVDKNGLSEYKGCSYSIGGRILNEEPIFTQDDIIPVRPCYIYLTSDGFADQNDHEKRKYGTKKLRDLLSEFYKQDITQQYKIISSEFDNHKLHEIQRDDVTIMGIKLNHE